MIAFVWYLPLTKSLLYKCLIVKTEPVIRASTNCLTPFHGLSGCWRLSELPLILTNRIGCMGLYYPLVGIFSYMDSGNWCQYCCCHYLRGLQLKLWNNTIWNFYHRRVQLDILKFLFNQRIVDLWNRLPQEIAGLIWTKLEHFQP